MIRSVHAHESAVLNIEINWPPRPPDAEIYDGPDDTEEWLQQMAARRAAEQRQRETLDARFASLELREVQA